jgi:L-ornithine N5-oxygenase
MVDRSDDIHQNSPRETVDILGVGFGPANLALAIALQEGNESGDLGSCARDVVFLDRQADFAWHPGMLLEGATMQVSFLKDLVTMRNPTSPHSFVAHLQAAGRLTDFINSGTMYPLRQEFHLYLQRVASHFDHMVRYDTEVTALRPVREDGVVTHLDVEARGADGQIGRFRARNVVIGTGLTPRVPDGARLSSRVWHSEDLLPRLANWVGDPPRAFVVVGAGQSAAESVAYLHDNYRDAEVHSVMSRMGFSATDDSPLGNRVFDPEAVDSFYDAPPSVKARLLEYHAATNYSVVDDALVHRLTDIVMSEALSGRRRLLLHGTSRIRGVNDDGAGGLLIDIESLSSSAISRVRVDALVYATGYVPSDPTPFVRELDGVYASNGDGRLHLERDYRVAASELATCGLYVHGAAAEHSHGISASLLSNVAVRAGEIASSIATHQSAAAAV